MTTSFRRVFIMITLQFIVILGAQAQDINSSFKKLTALSGTWLMTSGNDSLFENWTLVDDSSMKSTSFRVKHGDTTQLERVDLLKRNSSIFYIPTVPGENGNQPVPFSLSRIEGSWFTFENKAHDFPQRIAYSLPVQESLVAWIEGENHGQVKRIEYHYKRVH